MTFKQIMSELKSKKFRPLYFLTGEESYFIDQITDYICDNAVEKDKQAFNQIIMYGKDVNVAQIDNTARRFPMMSEKMLVVVKEAQNIRSLDKLVYYAQKPLVSTILVINYKHKTFDKRKKVFKEFDKNGITFVSKKMYDNQLPQWITEYITLKNYSIDPIATRMLADYLGNNLQKIANEIDKLIISIPDNTKITSTHIEKNIGISKDYNVFELQNALVAKDVLKANRIVKHFAANPKDNPFVLNINALFSFFSKILLVHSLKDKSKTNVAKNLKVHPFFANDYLVAYKSFSTSKLVQIISLLREYDLKSKGVNNISTTDGELMKELIFKILH